MLGAVPTVPGVKNGGTCGLNPTPPSPILSCKKKRLALVTSVPKGTSGFQRTFTVFRGKSPFWLSYSAALLFLG